MITSLEVHTLTSYRLLIKVIIYFHYILNIVIIDFTYTVGFRGLKSKIPPNLKVYIIILNKQGIPDNDFDI